MTSKNIEGHVDPIATSNRKKGKTVGFVIAAKLLWFYICTRWILGIEFFFIIRPSRWTSWSWRPLPAMYVALLSVQNGWRTRRNRTTLGLSYLPRGLTGKDAHGRSSRHHQQSCYSARISYTAPVIENIPPSFTGCPLYILFFFLEELYSRINSALRFLSQLLQSCATIGKCLHCHANSLVLVYTPPSHREYSLRYH